MAYTVHDIKLFSVSVASVLTKNKAVCVCVCDCAVCVTALCV